MNSSSPHEERWRPRRTSTRRPPSVATTTPLVAAPIVDDSRAANGGRKLAILAGCLFGPLVLIVPTTIYAFFIPGTNHDVGRLLQLGMGGLLTIAAAQASRTVCRWLTIGPWRPAFRWACGLPTLITLAAIPAGVAQTVRLSRIGVPTGPLGDEITIFALGIVATLAFLFWAVVWARLLGQRDLDPHVGRSSFRLRLGDILAAMATTGVALAAVRVSIGFDQVAVISQPMTEWAFAAPCLAGIVGWLATIVDFAARSAVRGETPALRQSGVRTTGAIGLIAGIIVFSGVIVVALPTSYDTQLAAALAAPLAGMWIVAFLGGSIYVELVLRALGIRAVTIAVPSFAPPEATSTMNKESTLPSATIPHRAVDMAERLRRFPFVLWIGPAVLGPLLTIGVLDSLETDASQLNPWTWGATWTFVVATVRGLHATCRWIAIGPGGLSTRLAFGPALLFAIWLSPALLRIDPSRWEYLVALASYVAVQSAAWGVMAAFGERDRPERPTTRRTSFRIRDLLISLALLSVLAAIARIAVAGDAILWRTDPLLGLEEQSAGPFVFLGLTLFGLDAAIRNVVSAGSGRRRAMGFAIATAYLLFSLPMWFSIPAFDVMVAQSVTLLGLYLGFAASYDLLLSSLGFRATNVRGTKSRSGAAAP